MKSEQRHSLSDLAALAGLPQRTVRYYIQRGLLDRPIGETRAAYYTASHLERLLEIRRWTQAGVSLERIQELLAGAAEPARVPERRSGTVEVRSHLTVAPGIELVVEPGRAGLAPEQVRRLFRDVLALHERLLKGDEE